VKTHQPVKCDDCQCEIRNLAMLKALRDAFNTGNNVRGFHQRTQDSVFRGFLLENGYDLPEELEK